MNEDEMFYVDEMKEFAYIDEIVELEDRISQKDDEIQAISEALEVMYDYTSMLEDELDKYRDPNNYKNGELIKVIRLICLKGKLDDMVEATDIGETNLFRYAFGISQPAPSIIKFLIKRGQEILDSIPKPKQTWRQIQ